MSISNESLPIIAGIITNTARSMTTVMQYIYTVSDSDFYNINIKKVLICLKSLIFRKNLV
mgnify:FL=1